MIVRDHSKAQGCASCVTVTTFPPTVMLPVRASVVGFAVALYIILPVFGGVLTRPIPSQPVLAASAVHVQSELEAVTANIPAAPAAGSPKCGVDTVNVQATPPPVDTHVSSRLPKAL